VKDSHCNIPARQRLIHDYAVLERRSEQKEPCASANFLLAHGFTILEWRDAYDAGKLLDELSL